MFFEKTHRGETDTWLTPPWIHQALGRFDFDPCGHPLSETAEQRIFFPEEDGLKITWEGRVWLNPPYGPKTKLFLNKLSAHGSGTALVLARTDTRWLQNHLRIAKAILFIYGRIKFLNSKFEETNGCQVPSLLLAYGKDDADILMSCKIKGFKIRNI